MADRGNQQAHPPSQLPPQFYTPQGGMNPPGQSKPPGAAPNGPFQPGGAFPPGPAGSHSQPGQWAGGPPRPPMSVNGFTSQPQQPAMAPSGVPPRPQMGPVPTGQGPPRPPGPGQYPPAPPSSTQSSGPLMNGPGSMNHRPPLSSNLPPSSRPAQMPGAPPTNFQGSPSFPGYGPPPPGGGSMPPRPQAPPPSSSSSIAPGPGPVSPSQGTASNSIQSRPNELPVPFHGQGQYSHQVNPFLQKTPTPTPSNSEPPSERSSRGPSPVSGSTFDALEGQFTPGHGAPSPSFPGNRGSPVGGARNSPLPGPAPGTPPKVTGTYTPPPPGQASVAQPMPQHGQGPPGFTSPSQQMPPRPGFPPGPPRPPLSSPQSGGQFQPQSPPLYQGQMPPTSAGFPPPTSNQPAGFPPVSGQPAGFPPMPGQPAGPPPPTSNAQSRFPPPPTSTQATGYPQPPMSNAPGAFPPPPPSSSTSTGFPPSSMPGAGGLPPPPMSGSGPAPPQPHMMGPRPGVPPAGQQYGAMPPGPPTGPQGGYPTPQYRPPGPQQPGPGSYPNSMNAMTQNFGQMGMQDSQRVVNLLNERQLIPPDGIETARPTLPHDFKKVNCSPDIFRCTLNAIPQTSSLLSKARLPLGILIHPFRDLSQLPVIQSSVIVRCRSCRTYINPFVVFIDQRRWKCNLCFRVNDLPEEFSFDPVSKTYGDPQRRPEVKSATIEFIAPSEYMLRPPQPAVYLYLLDVSFNAVETGYLSQFCQSLLDELDKLPGDARTTIGFLCYDSTLYYFNLAEGLSQPQMLCVPDLEDPFLPCPDNLLVNLHESKELVIDLLNQLPNLFQGNLETGSALGAALQSAHKLMSPTGGRITVMQTCLPTVGPGALQNREAANNSGKNVTNIGPATDFYKKLSLDCSAQQIAVDLFMLNGQYADIATLSCISKYSGGCIYYYPKFHTVRNPGLVDKFDTDLRRYLTRKIGFESVMRIRCTRGLSIHTFHGNFFVRSTDLLSLPNINPDAGFGMQMSIEDSLNDSSTVSFQAALLYTSSKGERRIRVHTLCVPVTNQLSDVFTSADQEAIAALLAKMAVDRSLNSAISDARDAMMNASLDALAAYGQQVPASQRVGALLAPKSLRLMPMFMLAMLKNTAFSVAGNTKVDDRVFAMQQFKVLPVCYLIQSLYPNLYPLHRVSDENPIKRGKEEIPSAPLMQLSSANIDRTGLFLMDTGEAMYLLVGSGIGDQMCQEVFDKPNFMSIPEGMMDLPELENPTSEKIRSFVNYLMDSRPNGITFLVIRDDSKYRHLFFQHMLEDRTENSMSYYEFLQFLQGKGKG